MFFGKFLIAALVLSAMVVIEMSVLVGCAKYWFPSYVFDLTEDVYKRQVNACMR